MTAQNLKKLRKEKNLTPNQVAQSLGFSKSHFSRIENGKK